MSRAISFAVERFIEMVVTEILIHDFLHLGHFEVQAGIK